VFDVVLEIGVQQPPVAEAKRARAFAIIVHPFKEYWEEFAVGNQPVPTVVEWIGAAKAR
jgi:hypothetical protein